MITAAMLTRLHELGDAEPDDAFANCFYGATFDAAHTFTIYPPTGRAEVLNALEVAAFYAERHCDNAAVLMPAVATASAAVREGRPDSMRFVRDLASLPVGDDTPSRFKIVVEAIVEGASRPALA